MKLEGWRRYRCGRSRLLRLISFISNSLSRKSKKWGEPEVDGMVNIPVYIDITIEGTLSIILYTSTIRGPVRYPVRAPTTQGAQISE